MNDTSARADSSLQRSRKKINFIKPVTAETPVFRRGVADNICKHFISFPCKRFSCSGENHGFLVKSAII